MKWNKTFALVANTIFVGALLTSVVLPGHISAQSLIATPKRVTTDQSTVVVKLKPSASASLSNNRFISKDTAAANQLNNVLSASKVVSKRALINDNSATIRAQQVQPNSTSTSSKATGNLADYFTLQLAPGEKADAVAAKLKALDVVETAYAKQLPAPAPVAPSYAGLQTYLKASPTGLGVNATIGGTATTKLYPGTNGSKIKIADLEYSWNTQHEDLSVLRASGALWANGTPVNPFTDDDHGTAVAGIIAADRNGAGVDGIVPNVSYHMVNTNNSERGWDVANAVYTATNNMSAGDVILIEQQAWSPDGLGYAPIEAQQDVYDAIVYATSKGVHVIEPAGNGNASVWQGYNLNDAQFNGMFTTARPSSGAIMVGAGSMGCSGTPTRARMAYSNYGSRIDVQGPGECVATTGYGDLRSTSRNSSYTSGFNGTSSASAAIAAITAELSSSYKYTNTTVLTTASLKADLQTGGLAQNTTTNPGKIGVFPNMATVLPLTDVTKPTAPTTLTGKATAANKIALSWKAASDNLGYVKYYVYRDGVKLATATSTGYVDTALKTKVKHTYKVYAVDASTNLSTASNSVTILNK